MKPLSLSTLFTRAGTLQAEGRPDDALALYLQLLQANPRHYPSLAKSCNLLMAQRRYAEARPLLLRALELAPREALLFSNLAHASLRLGDSVEALRWAEQALQLKPGHLKALYTLGRAHDLLGDYQRAMAAYNEILAADPAHAKARFGLGMAAAHAGQFDLAEQQLRHSLELRLQHPPPVQPARPAAPTPIGVDPAAAEATLWRTLAELHKLGFHVFPGSGTQLGLYRDGGLLHWDKDLDLGMPLSELGPVSDWFRQQGCEEYPNPMRLANKRVFAPADTLLVFDLTGLAKEKATGRWLGGFWQEGQRLDSQRVTEFPPLKLRRNRSPAGPVWMLAEPEPWLQAVYGDGWRTPDPAWDSVVAARNLRGFAPLTRIYGYLRIWSYWQGGEVAKSLSTTRHCLRHRPDDPLLLALATMLESLQPNPA